jgi:DNA end-binding protein Ku
VALFEPEKFEDHYELALAELLAKKQKGQPISPPRWQAPGNVINFMDALLQSLASSGKAEPASKPAPGLRRRRRRRKSARRVSVVAPGH